MREPDLGLAPRDPLAAGLVSRRTPPLSVAPPPVRPGHSVSTVGRERLIAFAFAAADMLVELAEDDSILWADGRFVAHFGLPAASYIGKPGTMLFAARDQDLVSRCLLVARNQGRIQPLLVSLASNRETRAVLSALALPDENGRVLITIGPPPGDIAEPAPAIQDIDTLLRIAPNWLGAEHQTSLDVIEVNPGQSGDGSALNALVESKLARIVEEVLGSGAVLAQVSANRFAVLGSTVSQIDAIAATLEAQLRANPTGRFVKIGHVTIDLALDGLDARRATAILRATLRGLTQQTSLGPAAPGQGGRRISLPEMLGTLRRQADRLTAIIERRAFSLAYQPIVCMQTGEIQHYEALIRPNVAGTGYISPGEFIATAESLGLSEMVDLAVAEAALRQVACSGNVAVAVNVSAASIERAAFTDKLLQLAATRGPSRVLIEITETAEISDLAAARRSIERLRRIGLAVCLDDFGAGNASFRYLRELPVDYVKLDGSYTRSAARNARELTFIHSLRELANTVGAKVIAEMVETAAEADMLRGAGIQYAQGFHYARPGRLPGCATTICRPTLSRQCPLPPWDEEIKR